MAKAKAKTTTDAKVLELLERVKEKKKQIATLSKPQWKTSASLSLPGFETINLQVERNTSKLVLAIGVLLQLEAQYAHGINETGVNVDAVWNSYPIEDWVADVKQRIGIINIESERKKLATMEETLNSLTSEEQRREMKLAEILGELGE